MEFGRKHLLNKFFLEGDQRKSLRNIISREMIANSDDNGNDNDN